MTGYYQSMEFCGDLKRWTSQILSDDGGPNVHSVSPVLILQKHCSRL